MLSMSGKNKYSQMQNRKQINYQQLYIITTKMKK